MIDLHCHLDLYPNPKQVVESCRIHKVFVVSVTTTPAAFRGTASLVREGDSIETALGLHPQLAGDRYRELDLFEEQLGTVRWVGEIGLDGSADHKATWEVQVRVFERILHFCAASGGRLMSIHSRAAAGAVLASLKRFPNAGTPVLHWFSGTLGELDVAISFGCWFSVGLPMLRSKKGRMIVSRIPRDRVLTETDGPFVESNGTPVQPWDVDVAEKELASLWRLPFEDTQATLRNNLESLRAQL
jgi:TatD DNase family protein